MVFRLPNGEKEADYTGNWGRVSGCARGVFAWLGSLKNKNRLLLRQTVFCWMDFQAAFGMRNTIRQPETQNGAATARRQHFKHRITDLPRCQRAADAPLVTGLAKVSGCLLLSYGYLSFRCLSIQ